jgi:uncharacterized membrane protein
LTPTATTVPASPSTTATSNPPTQTTIAPAASNTPVPVPTSEPARAPATATTTSTRMGNNWLLWVIGLILIVGGAILAFARPKKG